MDWRVFTLINSIIALVTLIAVAFDFNAYRRSARSNDAESGTQRSATGSRHHSGHRSISSLADLRVDKLESVPPAEFYEMFLDATPAEMNALAMKFNALPPNVHTAGGIRMFFQAWTELDGKSALRGAFQIKSIYLRRMAVDSVVHSVSPGAAPELATYLNQNPDKDLPAYDQNRLMAALLERWSSVDPAAAARFLDRLGDTNLADSASNTIAFAWGSLDPPSALTWMEKTNHANQSDLFMEIINGWARIDSAAARAYLTQHADHPGAKAAAESMVDQLVADDPNQAVTWVNSLPSRQTKIAAEERLALSWAATDPATAAHWAEALPKSDQASVIPPLAGAWATQDWAATRRWIGTLSSDLRDQAISYAIGNSLSNVAPTETLPLAMSMSDRDQRMRTVASVIRGWAASDRQAAETWLRTSTLRRTEKDELLTMFSEQTGSEEAPRIFSGGMTP